MQEWMINNAINCEFLMLRFLGSLEETVYRRWRKPSKEKKSRTLAYSACMSFMTSSKHDFRNKMQPEKKFKFFSKSENCLI